MGISLVFTVDPFLKKKVFKYTRALIIFDYHNMACLHSTIQC